jgi:imidazolonepropionase-like amidohydrolase
VLALAGGTVYTDPFSPPIANGTVLLDGARIAAVGTRIDVPAQAPVLDCAGCTVTAGFWNCHVHFFERKWGDAAQIPAHELAEQLSEFTRFGFTSVFDLGSSWQNTRSIRDRIDSAEVDGPAIYSTGEIIVPPGAVPPESVLRVLGTMPVKPHEVETAQDAEASARAILAQGVDALKIFASGNAPQQKLARYALHAAVATAHDMRKPVFAHTNDTDDVVAALEAGVDVIAHTTPRSGAWHRPVTALAASSGAALTPTLGVWPHLMRHDRVSLVRQLRESAVTQLRAWIESGGSVLFGTDHGAVEPDPAPEFALMREAGMSFAQILDSLTTAPARRFGAQHTQGRVAAGYAADLTVFSTPFDVRYAIRVGRVIYQRP